MLTTPPQPRIPYLLDSSNSNNLAMALSSNSDDGFPRSRSRPRRRDQSPWIRQHSPDYYSGGAALETPPYAPLAPREPNMSLQVPVSRHRPRSVPPPNSTAVVRQQQRHRSRPRSRSSSRSSRSSSHSSRDAGDRSPLGKARHVVKESFTHTPAGLGVGLLGAIVGGLAAREVSDATVRRHNSKLGDDGRGYRSRNSREHQKSKIVSTIVGAVVGGFGANAFERKLENARERDRDRQESWEKKFGRESDLPHYDTGDARERDHGRGRSRDGDNGFDDHVYDNGRRAQRNRSEDAYRSRN